MPLLYDPTGLPEEFGWFANPVLPSFKPNAAEEFISMITDSAFSAVEALHDWSGWFLENPPAKAGEWLKAVVDYMLEDEIAYYEKKLIVPMGRTEIGTQLFEEYTIKVPAFIAKIDKALEAPGKTKYITTADTLRKQRAKAAWDILSSTQLDYVIINGVKYWLDDNGDMVMADLDDMGNTYEPSVVPSHLYDIEPFEYIFKPLGYKFKRDYRIPYRRKIRVLIPIRGKLKPIEVG